MQLSETVDSRIGSVFLTQTAAAGGPRCLVFWEETERGALARVVDDVIGAAGPSVEIQETALTKDGHRVTLTVAVMTDVLYGALRAQCDAAATTFDAVLNLAGRDGAGAERSVTFTAVKWISLRVDPAVRFAARYYRGVKAELVSVAAT